MSVSSLALVAPVLYPDRALHSVLQSVTSDMAQDVLSEVAGWTPPQLHLPTVAIFGGADTIAPK